MNAKIEEVEEVPEEELSPEERKAVLKKLEKISSRNIWGYKEGRLYHHKWLYNRRASWDFKERYGGRRLGL